MYFLCISYVIAMHFLCIPIYSLSISYVFPICSYGFPMYLLCISYVSPMYSLCISFVFPMYFLRIPYVFPLYLLCISYVFLSISYPFPMYPLCSLSSLKGDPDARACLTHVADPINFRNVKGGGSRPPACTHPPTLKNAKSQNICTVYPPHPCLIQRPA